VALPSGHTQKGEYMDNCLPSREELIRRVRIFFHVLNLVRNLNQNIEIRGGVIRQVAKDNEVLFEVNMSRLWSFDTNLKINPGICKIFRVFLKHSAEVKLKKNSSNDLVIKDCNSALIIKDHNLTLTQKVSRGNKGKKKNDIDRFLTEEKLMQKVCFDNEAPVFTYYLDKLMLRKVRTSCDALNSSLEVQFDHNRIVFSATQKNNSVILVKFDKNPTGFLGGTSLPTTPFKLNVDGFSMELFSSKNGTRVVLKLCAWLDKGRTVLLVIWTISNVGASSEMEEV
jgi:hypothetical protein